MAASPTSDLERAAAGPAAAALPPPPETPAGRALNSLRVLWQCEVALLLCAPLMLAAAVAWLPLSVLSWLTVEYFELRRKVGERPGIRGVGVALWPLPLRRRPQPCGGARGVPTIPVEM